ncbi:Swi5-domain-containing protein [Violaceomyces palustris]|uniref:Swi5-domain-containing protein n=1 Tax=Violaceomyces palustris TaxID=1673888 RepID=A0ACD0P8P0_9BASI|nr:Swi5-domain-containing protein [Violaceomyces palustris]
MTSPSDPNKGKAAHPRRFKPPLLSRSVRDGASPMPTSSGSGKTQSESVANHLAGEQEIQELRNQIQELETRLSLLLPEHRGKDPYEVVGKHIKLLNEYNEVKDATQVLFGRLASLEGVTSKTIHERYGIGPED